MASYNELNALIDAYINRNGVQAITGQILNGVLKAMVEQLGRGYTIMGAAIPTTDPGTPDGPECYFASETGTYTDFDGLQVVPGELALLCYTPSDGWTKETIYEGFQAVQATIDGNVGTPAVGVSYANGILSFDFHNMKGVTGDPAGFGAVTASVDSNIGTPSVQVQTSGPDTAKAIAFQFHNLKGETGVTSVLATVDNTSGNPQCAVSLNGQQLVLNFTGLKGAQGDTGSSVDYPFTIVNNLTTDDATQALSAAQGVVLAGQVSQLEHDVDDLDGQINGRTTVKNVPIDTGTDGYRIASHTGQVVVGANRNVCLFPITYGKTYHLKVPALANQYTAVYGFFVQNFNYLSNYVTLPSPVITGPITNYEEDITAPSETLKYLVVTYEPASGLPTLTTTEEEEGLVERVEELESDGAVTTQKISNGAVTTPKIAVRAVSYEKIDIEIVKEYYPNEDYRGCIAELYSNAPKDEGSHYGVKYYGGMLYFRPIISKQSFPTNYWQSITDISTWKNNVLYPLFCTTGNDVLNVNEGELVGYIVFRDIDSFRSTPLGAPGYALNDEQVRDIRFSPSVISYLSGFADGSVTTQKIANNAVTLEKLADGLIPDNSIDINVPDTIYAVVGDKLQLYYESIFKVVNPFVFDIKVSCNIGAQYPRYFEVTPTIAQVGDYTLKFVIKDYNGKQLGTKSCTLRVVESTASPSVNVLCVGASTTVGGEWVGEMKKRLTTNAGTPTKNSGGTTIFTPTGFNLPNVNFVGRMEANGAKFEATGGFNFNSYNGVLTYICHFYFAEQNLPNVSLGDVYSDGTNQFTITEINIPRTTGEYAGNIGCSSSTQPHLANLSLTKVSGNGDATLTASAFDFKGNPFLYNGAVNIAQYATDFCNGQIDVVFAYLFANGIITPYQTDFTTALAAMRTFINNFVSAFPNCKFGIVLSQNKDARGGLGYNYGAAESNIWTYEFGMKVSNHNLLTALQEYITEENLANVFIVNNLNEFDYMNDYQQTNKQVNPRSGVTEVFGRNGVHPSTIGYYQIADSATRAFIGKYNES